MVIGLAAHSPFSRSGVRGLGEPHSAPLPSPAAPSDAPTPPRRHARPPHSPTPSPSGDPASGAEADEDRGDLQGPSLFPSRSAGTVTVFETDRA